jgi:predicted RNA polymerase sigma factor
MLGIGLRYTFLHERAVLMHAARGTMLRWLGQRDAAKAAFERAAHLAATEADRRFLAQQIEALAEDGALSSLGRTD